MINPKANYFDNERILPPSSCNWCFHPRHSVFVADVEEEHRHSCYTRSRPKLGMCERKLEAKRKGNHKSRFHFIYFGLFRLGIIVSHDEQSEMFLRNSSHFFNISSQIECRTSPVFSWQTSRYGENTFHILTKPCKDKFDKCLDILG